MNQFSIFVISIMVLGGLQTVYAQNGSLDMELEVSDEEKISRIIEWAHGGPANARVEDVEIHNEKFIGEFSKFDVLY